MSYLGNSPGLVTQRLVNTFTATASQTTFTTTSTYVVGYVDVYVNGVKLNTADFVASSGNTVVLAEPCVSGDIVDILLYFPRALTDGYTKLEADTRFQPLDGPLVVSANTSSNALRITQTGTGNALLVEDSANPDSTPFVVNTFGQVLFGNTTSISYQTMGLAYNSGKAQIVGADGNTSSQLIAQYNTGSTVAIPTLVFAKSKNATVGSHTIVASGDSLGAVSYDGSDGTNFIEAARVWAQVDGTPGTNDMPGRLVFSTTADGASSPTERMRIDSAGNVGIGTTASAFKLDVIGNASIGNNQLISNIYETLAIGERPYGDGYASIGFYPEAGNFVAKIDVVNSDNTFNIWASKNSTQGNRFTVALGVATEYVDLKPRTQSVLRAQSDGTTHRVGINTISPNYTLEVNGSFAANNATLNGILQLGSYAAIKALIETATVSATAATGTINYDVATQAVLYYTSNATANWTLNLRGSSTLSLNSMLAIGQSLTVAFLVQQGGTAYYPTTLQVDGSSITPKWQGGTAPTSGNTNSIDVYTYTVIKTANATYTALASQTKFT